MVIRKYYLALKAFAFKKLFVYWSPISIGSCAFPQPLNVPQHQYQLITETTAADFSIQMG